MEKAAELMLLMFFVLNGLIFFAGRWFAQRSLAPINRLIAQIKQITVQNLHVRVYDGKGKDEIAELAQNVNRLLVHLQSSFELQQGFVSNASHELRTPVTSIIGEIEVSLNYERTSVEYQQVLNSVLYESERLNNTITRLMELAQADFEYSRAKLSTVMIDELIWELHAFWIKKLGQGKFLLDIQHLPDDAGMLSILANKSLLTIAFNNIIDNAFKFSNNQPVKYILNADEDCINIIIEDSGVGVPDVDAEMIFDSFYRSPNGRTYSGTGVGLYVIQKIIQSFKGKINMLSTEGKGTTFKTSKF
ncbi:MULTISPECIES: ATP-binding protein [unclassified Mucilaginibacter]|uniref:HAMP domain-containing sensor histidine kinase n=1 Tax=unclassified Mucilaginibacter TaxID=2617802 RepID=UPI002AC96FF3|nr:MULTISPECIES: ATP-binding protein [unclassified Mucilaginibacter]MEB0263251.1 ATP-binding protein [Mucilaginibacter sp. 10I4]MEB0280826.1 ATP-binding protein [Mucilaginibacter sp. 10B2]MEB0302297.1 ATP-binding protein [Mucilaginibacter sp. 5C4]WPX25685.1 ATP-binding protein [Mucilaginibacter sp. 5C4]